MAEVLFALQAPPDRREVAGWGEALTVYRETAFRPEMPGRKRSRRPRSTGSPLSARVAAAASVAAVAVLGGGVAAAYTGSLPGALQKIAHEAFAAPAGRQSPAMATSEGTGRSVEPSASDSAAYGLCNAYQHADASQRATAFRNLVKAAGGADQVAAYCASVPHPGTSSPPGRREGQTASPTSTSHGRKPTTAPGKGNGNGNGGGNGSGGGNGGGGGRDNSNAGGTSNAGSSGNAGGSGNGGSNGKENGHGNPS